jgi:hypothetical protein
MPRSATVLLWWARSPPATWRSSPPPAQPPAGPGPARCTPASLHLAAVFGFGPRTGLRYAQAARDSAEADFASEV